MTKEKRRNYQADRRDKEKRARALERMKKMIVLYMKKLGCSGKEAKELYKVEYPKEWETILNKKRKKS
jgi:hypothetical protein